ncbi:MAG: FliI/YscN family ATPase [Pseudomonadales bacterium]|jgi:flagellum-specific ATP synthase|nr:FliI/YscN family ATPase [Pseudomonadales bacterium]
MSTLEARRSRLASGVARLSSRLAESEDPVVEGRLSRVVGLTLEAIGCRAEIGSRCTVIGLDGEAVDAEVVGFAEDRLFLMPTAEAHGLAPGARVVPERRQLTVPCGDGLLGRIIDAAGRPIDDRGPLAVEHTLPLAAPPVNPMLRPPVTEPLDVGVRAINGVLTVGRGQRVGLFAGSGVGKSVLLGMLTRFSEADVIVVGLIGERGREVREFVQHILGTDGMARAVVVATPADQPPLFRLHGAMMASRIAEGFALKGRRVLLLMDSLTRYAQAQREIGLAIGEPPTTKGYPPSVFTRLPKLVERAGNFATGGSVTAIYTVLAEGDDVQDPVADAARAILDGHIVLSRRLAESGHYPAIDVEASASRVFTQVTSPAQQQAAQRLRELLAALSANRDLLAVGAYQRGVDHVADAAIDGEARINAFLRQGMSERVDLAASLARLVEATGEPAPGPGVP